MTADTVAAGTVTRESAIAISQRLASELVPPSMRYVSRDTAEPFITLELIAGDPGSIVTHQRQVTRRCDARTFERACRTAWAELIQLHRASARRHSEAQPSYTANSGPVDFEPFPLSQLVSETVSDTPGTGPGLLSSIADTVADTFSGGGGDFGGGGASGDF